MSAELILTAAYLIAAALTAREAFVRIVRWHRTEYPRLDFDAGDLLFSVAGAFFAGSVWPIMVTGAFVWPLLESWADRIQAGDPR